MALVEKRLDCLHIKVCKLCGPSLCLKDCGHYILCKHEKWHVAGEETVCDICGEIFEWEQ